jgi:ribosomal protein S18 acetylase RimI-like enzyme
MGNSDILIKECTDYEASAQVIREAFSTVAQEFSLTRENAPSNGAFIEGDALKKLADKGLKLLDVFQGGMRVGFFALEDAGGGVYYLEKLSVAPEERHNGIGKTILDFAVKYVKRHSGKKISIAIIKENTVLKRWYIDYGFTEMRLKKFEHLPFTVCFMELPV